MFGANCWYNLRDNIVMKIEKLVRKTRMSGYVKESKGYRLYDGEDRKLVVKRDVRFDK